MKTEGYQVAFPTTHEHPSGLTKREYFAAHAMAGLLANPRLYDDVIKGVNKGEDHTIFITIAAVLHADELIKALNDE